MKEIVSYKGKLCEKESDFIWGDYIEMTKSLKVYIIFWHHQNLLRVVMKDMVYTGGDKYVDKDYKESTDLHIPVNLTFTRDSQLFDVTSRGIK